MADAPTSSDKGHNKPKVIRSQKIMAVMPDEDDPGDAPKQHRERASSRTDRGEGSEKPTPPRSHTPGHLASKSADRRQRKPSDLHIRTGRSQSVSQAAGSASKTPVSSRTPTSSSATTSSTPKPPPIPNGHVEEPSRSRTVPPPSSANPPLPSGPTPAPGALSDPRDKDKDGRRPAAMRSTSAIAGKPAAVAVAGARHATGSKAAASRAEHVPFPPLDDPKTAPDVPPAPASGMYWSKAPVSGSPHTALRAHTTTLVGSNIYVFGGCDSRACFNELYVFDGDAFYWSVPHVAGQVPLPLRAMTCTAVGKKLVIFGGGDGPAYYNDIYVLDTVNFRWSKPRVVGDRAPSKRRAHTACFYKNGIYVFGGGDGVRALNDIWRLDVGDVNKMSWRLISSPEKSGGGSGSGSSSRDVRPKARGYHTANIVGGKLIIFGGSDGGECFSDVWVYDIDRQIWKCVDIDETYRRLSHTATIVGSYLFVIGGHDGEEYSNDVLLLNLTTMAWEKRKTYGLPPSGRGYHGTVLHDSRLFVIGGFDGSEVFGDVWILELAVHAYYSQISHFTIDV